MPIRDEKLAALRAAHALNPAPETVRDDAFTSGDPFFDPRDIVQVKYEMLRRVAREGHSVTSAAAAFGFSRPSFYAAQAAWQSTCRTRAEPCRVMCPLRSSCAPDS